MNPEEVQKNDAERDRLLGVNKPQPYTLAPPESALQVAIQHWKAEVATLKAEKKDALSKLEMANQLNADMNKQRQEMIRRAYDAELQLGDMGRHAAALRVALLRFGSHQDCDGECKCGLSAILNAVPSDYAEKRVNECNHDHDRGWQDGKLRCGKCGDVIPAEKKEHRS